MTQEERIIYYLHNEYGKGNGNVKIVISALEKQIPKRPIEDGYYDEPSVCPNCGCDVINQADNDYKFECCYHCGQRLDWSDHPTEKGGKE